MKRLFVLLLLALLIPTSTLAFDVSPYLLEPETEFETTFDVLPLSADAYYRLSSGANGCAIGEPDEIAFFDRFRLYEDGQCTFDMICPEEGSYSLLLRPERQPLVMHAISSAEPQQAWKHAFTLYDLDGDTLVNARTFQGDPYDLADLGSGFAGICPDEQNQCAAVVYDEQLNLVFRHVLPFDNAALQCAVRSGDYLYLHINQRGKQTHDDSLLLCVDAGNALAWTRSLSPDSYRWNNLMPDGEGGILLSGSLVKDYMQYRMMRISPSGEALWAKTLSAPRAIAFPQLAVVQRDSTIALYGRCIAKSRGVFTVFCMHLDAQGNTLSLDVRDYSARADTGPEVLPAKDGTMLVYSFEVSLPDQPAVLVPFDELPETENPGITLK